MLTAGTKLAGVFEILGPLGSGAMGEVYRARDSKLGRDVAIKVLPQDLARDAARLGRFEHEARAASALNHPNIVTVHGIGRDGDLVYLILELVQGRTLRDRLAKGGMPWRTTLHIAEQIAAGLAAAHAGGIVHRDLKPENVMVRDDGVVKILDFGLAKLQGAANAELATATAFTSPGAILGTVGYMSPEQARGEAVDWRSDQFALGCILYEMATGERPFAGASSAQTLTAIIEKEPEPVSRNRADAPRPVLWILERCLAKDPRDRYGSTLDLARDLRNVRESLSTASSDAHLPVAGPARRKVRAVVPIACLLLGAVVGAILGSLWTRRSNPGGEPPTVRTITFSGQDYMPSASSDGRMLTFVSRRDGVPRIWLKSLADGNEVVLTSGPDFAPRFSPDRANVLFTRGEAQVTSLYRVPTLGGEARRVVLNATDADWSPDGSRIVFLRVGAQGGTTVTAIVAANADGGAEHELLTVRDAALSVPRWSPDGKWIAVSAGQFGASESSGKYIQLVRADGSDARRLSPPQEGGDVSGISWLHDGRTLLYSQGESVSTVSLGAAIVNSGASRIQVQDIVTGKGRTVLWSPSLTTTITLVGPGHVVFDAASARQNLMEYDISQTPAMPLKLLSQGTSLDRQPTYTPDGQWVVFTSNRSGNLDIWAHSRQSGELRQLTDHQADDWDPAFTRDGKQLIWTSRRGGNFEIWMANADGSSPRQITRDGVDAENATATPDGAWLVYNSANPAKAGIWKIRIDGTQAERLVEGTTGWPEISPDGTVVAYAVGQGSTSTAVAFVRIADGQNVPFRIVLDSYEVPNGRCRWFPDGRSIAFNWRAPNVPGIYAQEYRPGEDTTPTRRALVKFDNDATPETFGLSPDGTRMTLSASHRMFSLMSATNIAHLDAAPRPAQSGR